MSNWSLTPKYFWNPLPNDLTVNDGIKYLSVDEIYEGVATVIVSDWPTVSETGRLNFADDATSYWAEAADLSSFLGQTIATSDVFAITPDENGMFTLNGDEGNLTLNGDFTDVTKQAQDAADAQHALLLYGPTIIG